MTFKEFMQENGYDLITTLHEHFVFQLERLWRKNHTGRV